MKYDPAWLQAEAIRLGSWNKVCKKYSISPRTIAKYKSCNLIVNVIENANVDLNEIQNLYDSGLSIRQISKMLDIPHSAFSKKIKTRDRVDANKLNPSVITEKGKRKLSILAKQRGLGGYRPHPNKGIYYNGIWFDSKWEVTVAKSLDEFGIVWERPKQGFVWTDTGRKYYPDFFLVNYGIYLDPKNPYLQIKDAKKIKEAQIRNNIKVLVLNKSQLSWETIKELL